MPIACRDGRTILKRDLLMGQAVRRADFPMRGVDLGEVGSLVGSAKTAEDQLIALAQRSREVSDHIALGFTELENEVIAAAAAGKDVLTDAAIDHVAAGAANQRVVALTAPKRVAQVVGVQGCAVGGEDAANLDIRSKRIVLNQRQLRAVLLWDAFDVAQSAGVAAWTAAIWAASIASTWSRG
jgi:hypothetical protein